MFNVGGKLLNGTKSMYVDSQACVKVKGSRVSGSIIGRERGVLCPLGC